MAFCFHQTYLSEHRGRTLSQRKPRHQLGLRPPRPQGRGKWALLRPTRREIHVSLHPKQIIIDTEKRLVARDHSPQNSSLRTTRAAENHLDLTKDKTYHLGNLLLCRTVAEARYYKCRMILKECTGSREKRSGLFSGFMKGKVAAISPGPISGCAPLGPSSVT
jgi:hypothetical protein